MSVIGEKLEYDSSWWDATGNVPPEIMCLLQRAQQELPKGWYVEISSTSSTMGLLNNNLNYVHRFSYFEVMQDGIVSKLDELVRIANSAN